MNLPINGFNNQPNQPVALVPTLVIPQSNPGLNLGLTSNTELNGTLSQVSALNLGLQIGKTLGQPQVGAGGFGMAPGAMPMGGLGQLPPGAGFPPPVAQAPAAPPQEQPPKIIVVRESDLKKGGKADDIDAETETDDEAPAEKKGGGDPISGLLGGLFDLGGLLGGGKSDDKKGSDKGSDKGGKGGGMDLEGVASLVKIGATLFA